MRTARAELSPLLVDFQTLTFLRGEKPVLPHLSLQIRAGEHVAILGPNGSGKSTLIKAITREIYPLPGSSDSHFRILGQENWDLTELRAQFGIVQLDLAQNLSHEVTVREVTGLDLVLSGFFNSIGLWPHHRVSTRQRQRAREILRFLQIEPLARRSIAAMSSGEQRRVMIGRALVHDPAALILDEPTNSLDPGAVTDFRRLLRRLCRAGHSVLLVTHNVGDIVPEIERVILVRDGRIVADGSKKRLLNSRTLSRLFGGRLRVHQERGRFELMPG
ncbi:MAG TPA: ATP-binding cassette domain-containing protein [Candidatus Didemnitutus sp.]|nr:ATP-binding cassette domain-containing protein [Candidatus Didemnitutus sp.]